MENAVIDFQVDSGRRHQAHWEYRPWGTRTLKIKVFSEKDYDKALWLEPAVRAAGDGLVYGLADDSQAFKVSWGGGHEPGSPTQVKEILKVFEKAIPLSGDKKTTYLYLNVTHIGSDLPDRARLTIRAEDEEGNQEEASLEITLVKPAAYQGNVMRLLPDANAANQWVVPANGNLADYDCRWWPKSAVTYTASERPNLQILRQDNQLRVQWENQDIALIKDQTSPATLDQPGGYAFELFNFDENHLVLRAWFNWFDTNLGSKIFTARHEVPDSERFDMLIHRHQGRVILACTDLHWRECWGYVNEPPLSCTVGLNWAQKTKLAAHGLKGFFIKGNKDTRPIYNPIGYIERMARRLADGDKVVRARAKGMEAHVPTLANVVQARDGGTDYKITNEGTNTSIHEMSSTDVRLG